MAEKASSEITLSDLPAPEDAAQLETQLETLCKRAAPEMEPSEYHFSGQLEPRGRQSHRVVLLYGRCYRIVAIGGAGITDLDLALFDNADVERLRDLGQTRVAQVGAEPELCPATSGGFRIDVSAFSGSGSYALQVLQTRPQL